MFVDMFKSFNSRAVMIQDTNSFMDSGSGEIQIDL